MGRVAVHRALPLKGSRNPASAMRDPERTGDGSATRGEPEGTVSVYVTVGGDQEAAALAKALLERRLIACANTWPIRSHFRWEGETKEEPEVAMWLKTTRDRVDELMAALPGLHGYDVPCVEVFEAGPVHGPFAAWVRDETRPRP